MLTKLNPKFTINKINHVEFDDIIFSNPTMVNLSLSYGEGGSAIASAVQSEINKYIAIAAIPTDNNIFEKWLINGVEYLSNPLSLLMNNDKTVVASFIINTLTKYYDTFNSLPTLINTTAYFKNFGIGKNVEVKNIKVADFGLAGNVYVSSSVYNVGGEAIDLTIDFYYSNVAPTTTRTLYRSAGSTGKGISIAVATNNIIQVNNYSGANTMVWNAVSPYLSGNGWKQLRITWNGQTGGVMTLYFYANNSLVALVTNSGTYSWVGNSSEVVKVGYAAGSHNSLIHRVILANKFDWVFNHNQGINIFDISGNNNNGIVSNANLTSFWASTSNNIEPYDLTKGATLYSGDALYNITDNTAWTTDTLGAFCYYDNDYNTNGSVYGALYNWVAVNSGLVSGNGWTVPSSSDFDTLAAYLGGASVAGGKMKAVGTTYWNTPNTSADNSSGFNGLGAGYRAYNNGVYTSNKLSIYFWTSTDGGGNLGGCRTLNYNSAALAGTTDQKKYGFSVRAMRANTDNLPDGTIISNAYTDGDGNTYNAVVIGTQVWTTTNLKTTSYQSGVKIMPICYNKPDEIAGYTRIGYYQPNSGIIKGLSNKYAISEVSPAIADGDYTADELAAINNANVIIEQNANAITSFKVFN